MRRSLAPVLAIAFTLLAATLVVAQDVVPAPGATFRRIGETDISYATWLGNESVSERSVTPGATTAVHVVLDLQEAIVNGTLDVRLDSASGTFGNATLSLALANATGLHALNTSLVVSPDATDNFTYGLSLNLSIRGEDGNVTSHLANETVVLGLTAVPAPPGPTNVWLIVAGAALVVGGGATAIALRQRAIRKKMNAAPRRSQVMRELELEKKLERAVEKDPEQAQVIKQEIREKEQVREKRRELQILEAKRADAMKTLELLKKRHEAGGLTKLQYDGMVAKKQADLAKIQADIAEMERSDEGAAA